MKQKLNLLTGEYDSIYIRRGDKLLSESVYIHASKYIDLLLKLNPECKTVFLQTDDYQSFSELEKYIETIGLQIHFITLCDPKMNGVFVFDTPKTGENNVETIKPFEYFSSDEIHNQCMEIITGIDIVRNSNICVCDYQSNVSRFIKLSHNNSNNVYDVMNPDNDIDMNRLECPAFGTFRGEQKLDCLVKYL